MKKVLVMFFSAVVLLACNNAADTEGDIKDSLDSIANERKDVIDSTAEQKKEMIDSTTEAKKEMVDTTVGDKPGN
ncbi:MAG TPA: hypothetical protein VFZ78_08990 [Flavisolibacter sp.]